MAGILIGVALILYIDFGRTNISTILILSFQKHGIIFHYLVTYVNSFFNILKFSLQKIFISLVRNIPKYFIWKGLL